MFLPVIQSPEGSLALTAIAQDRKKVGERSPQGYSFSINKILIYEQ